MRLTLLRLRSTCLLLVASTNSVNFSGLRFGLVQLQLPVTGWSMALGVWATDGLWRPGADDLTNAIALVGLLACGRMIGQNAFLVSLSQRQAASPFWRDCP